MKTCDVIYSSFCAALLCGAGLLLAGCDRPSPPAAVAPFKGKSTAGGVVMLPGAGTLALGSQLTISFPDAMVAAQLVGATNSLTPLAFEPALKTAFRWKSRSEGEVEILDAPVPGIRYRVALRPGLADAQNRPVAPPDWGAEFAIKSFHVDEISWPGLIGPKPEARVTFSHPVRPRDLARSVYFQDVASHKRFAAETTVEGDEEDAREVFTSFEITPARPLEQDRTYIVVVEGLTEARTGQPLDHLSVSKPASTMPPKALALEGQNEPLRGASIQVWFSQDMDFDTLNATTVSITPAVTNLDFRRGGTEDENSKFPGASRVVIHGDFDSSQSYQVRFNSGLRSRVGWPLVAAEEFRVVFGPKTPCVIFPQTEDLWQRAALGLDFSFLQVNTESLDWRLAQVPIEKLEIVQRRLREHERASHRSNSQRMERFPTHPLIPELQLEVVASNSFPATARDDEVLRQIRWKNGAAGVAPGHYLLEVTGKTPDGRLAGNRCLIRFSDFFIVEKTTRTSRHFRLLRMADGQPVAGASVVLLDEDRVPEAEAKTGPTGEATFPRGEDDRFVQFGEAPHELIKPLSESGSGSTGPSQRQFLFSDRNLYRPGEVVHFAGILRDIKDDLLAMPKTTLMPWRITDSSNNEIIDEGDSVVTNGGWQSTWKIPSDLSPGSYYLRAETALLILRVEEYRPPPFVVDVKSDDGSGTNAKAQVSSTYFHGAPNARARVEWIAQWKEVQFAIAGEESFRLNNVEPPDGNYVQSARRFRAFDPEAITLEVRGETVLDDSGRAQLVCPAPFPAAKQPGRSEVTWIVHVTSLEGQTQPGSSECLIQIAPEVPGVLLTQGTNALALDLQVRAFNLEGEAKTPLPFAGELYLVESKTVRERTGDRTFRYRHLPLFTRVWQAPGITPFRTNLVVAKPGLYAVVARAAGLTNSNGVGDRTWVSGDGEAEVDVNVAKITCTPERTNYLAGETARILITAPFAGLAYVSVEADEVLRSFFTELPGNVSRIEVPLDMRDCPNVFVRVHLVRGGNDAQLPTERFGECEFTVERPETRLTLTPALERTNVQPGELVVGTIDVRAAGKPAAAARVIVFATDQAVHTLGDWQLGDVYNAFYPSRWGRIYSPNALLGLMQSVERDSLWNKGFLLGDSGDGGKIVPRRNLQTLAFWNADLMSDEKGQVKFQFPAPDNLTSFHIVAIAHTDQQQLVSGETSFVISKRLQAEPVLPRFVRRGDEFDLRCAVRNRHRDDADLVRVRCEVGAGLQLIDAKEREVQAQRDVSTVAAFRVRVTGESGEASIRFEARSVNDATASDAIETKLRLEPATILRTETLYGEVAPEGLHVSRQMPGSWSNAVGQCDLIVSGTEWLPKLAGLPEIVEYPHECMDQTATRALAICLLEDLLEYLPDNSDRAAHYNRRLNESLGRIRDTASDSKGIGYWPGASENQFVTVECAWAVFAAMRRGHKFDERFTDDLMHRLFRFASEAVPERVSPLIRSFALMVMAQAPQERNIYSQVDRLCLESDRLDDEGRALLALALHYAQLMPDEKRRLLKEIDTLPFERPFDPENLGSASRAAALRLFASATIEGAQWSGAQRNTARTKLHGLLRSSQTLSTQEGFWVLLALNAIQQAEVLALPGERSLTPRPEFISNNKVSVAWRRQPFDQFQQMFSKNLDPGKGNFFLLRAAFRSPVPEVRQDRGLRLERVVKNLTAPARDGSAQSPLRLGDQLLITYRILADAPQFYIALTDELPGALEVVNPDLPLIAKSYQLPHDAEFADALQLSNAERRDQRTVLYFDRVPAGKSHYSVLARVIAAGDFRWPGTQAVPMYDGRYSAVGDAITIHAVSP